MHKIDKFLTKLDKENRQRVFDILTRIKSGNFENLNLKKLGGYESRYRVRVGRYRIIFEMIGNSIRIIDADKKNDNTYNL